MSVAYGIKLEPVDLVRARLEQHYNLDPDSDDEALEALNDNLFCGLDYKAFTFYGRHDTYILLVSKLPKTKLCDTCEVIKQLDILSSQQLADLEAQLNQAAAEFMGRSLPHSAIGLYVKSHY
jgi:hypothetical protein